MINLEFLTAEASRIVMTNLQEFCEKEDLTVLTPELSSTMIEEIKGLSAEVGQMILAEILENYDVNDMVIEEDSEIYRWKYKKAKSFMTCLGKIRVNRSVYQKDRGGKSTAPLDRMWNMEHEYLSAEVQEGLLYASANNTAIEVEKKVEKIGLFDVPASTIKNLVKTTGELVEENKDKLMKRIHEKEEMIDKPDIMVSSLDGVNVLLNEKGKKKGRPKERPDKQTSTESKSAYKNAICGSVSY